MAPTWCEQCKDPADILGLRPPRNCRDDPHRNAAPCHRPPSVLKDGLLAFYLYEDNLCSIVWSVPPERANELLAMDKVQFERNLTAAFDGRLGICQLESERQAFPLRMRYAAILPATV